MFTKANLKNSYALKAFIWLLLICFNSNLILCPASEAQTLPSAGEMIPLSQPFLPATLKGIKIFPDNPLRFDFFIDLGDSKLNNKNLPEESTKLMKYFLAALTVPEKDLWVNLSPHEKNRIIPERFGATEMGRDLLTQDYLLKQITSSLLYPEGELGKKFWDKVYADLYKNCKHDPDAPQNGGSGPRPCVGADIPIDAFNKVWIVPQKAVIYENGDRAFVVESKLKVMLQNDIPPPKSRRDEWGRLGGGQIEGDPSLNPSPLAFTRGRETQLIEEIILPVIEREVNDGANFANLRQIYNAIILATWFKHNLQKSLLGQSYVDQNKVQGVDVADKNIKQEIYERYLEAFKKGTYDYIKEDYDPATQQITPRKYFSGGAGFENNWAMTVVTHDANSAMLSLKKSSIIEVKSGLKEITQPDAAMLSDLKKRTADIPERELYEKVRVLRTGGTLEMAGQESRRSVNAIDRLIKENENSIIYNEKAFENLPDSSNIGPEEWKVIISHLRSMIQLKKELKDKLREEPGLPSRPGGIIVTTGTDTVDQIAFISALELTDDLNFPVAFTAASKPMDLPDSDVRTNFELAKKVAQSDQLPPKFYFAFANHVHLASRIKKFIATEAKGATSQILQSTGGEFESYGDIAGRMTDGQLEINPWIFDYGKKPSEKISETGGSGYQAVKFGTVEYLVIDNYTPGDVIKDASTRLLELKEKGQRVGLVIQGKVTSQQQPEVRKKFISVIQKLMENGIPVFAGSRDTVATWGRSGIWLLPKYITYAKARIKLAWLLGKNIPFDDINFKMVQDYVGEVPPLNHFPKSHIYETLPKNNYREGTEVIMAYQEMSPDIIRDSVKRLQRSPSKYKRLFIYGFGDGNLQLGHEPLEGRVIGWFNRNYPAYSHRVEEILSAKIKQFGQTVPLIQILEETLSELIANMDRDSILKLLSVYHIHFIRPLNDELISDLFKNISESEQQDHMNPAKMIETLSTYSMFKSLQNSKKDIKNLGQLKKTMTKLIEEISLEDLLQFTQRNPKWLARRMAKDALAVSHPLLKALAEATDNGINVSIRTNAYRSKTNTKMYELGNMLLIVGVDSEVTKGWPTVFTNKNGSKELTRGQTANHDAAMVAEIDPGTAGPKKKNAGVSESQQWQYLLSEFDWKILGKVVSGLLVLQHKTITDMQKALGLQNEKDARSIAEGTRKDPPDMEPLLKLANYFQVSVFTLLTGQRTLAEVQGRPFVPYDFKLFENYFEDTVYTLMKEQEVDTIQMGMRIGDISKDELSNLKSETNGVTLPIFLNLLEFFSISPDELLRAKPLIRRDLPDILQKLSKVITHQEYAVAELLFLEEMSDQEILDDLNLKSEEFEEEGRPTEHHLTQDQLNTIKDSLKTKLIAYRVMQPSGQLTPWAFSVKPVGDEAMMSAERTNVLETIRKFKNPKDWTKERVAVNLRTLARISHCSMKKIEDWLLTDKKFNRAWRELLADIDRRILETISRWNIQGEFLTLDALGKKLGYDSYTIRKRKKKNLGIGKAFEVVRQKQREFHKAVNKKSSEDIHMIRVMRNLSRSKEEIKQTTVEEAVAEKAGITVADFIARKDDNEVIQLAFRDLLKQIDRRILEAVKILKDLDKEITIESVATQSKIHAQIISKQRRLNGNIRDLILVPDVREPSRESSVANLDPAMLSHQPQWLRGEPIADIEITRARIFGTGPHKVSQVNEWLEKDKTPPKLKKQNLARQLLEDQKFVKAIQNRNQETRIEIIRAAVRNKIYFVKNLEGLIKALEKETRNNESLLQLNRRLAEEHGQLPTHVYIQLISVLGDRTFQEYLESEDFKNQLSEDRLADLIKRFQMSGVLPLEGVPMGIIWNALPERLSRSVVKAKIKKFHTTLEVYTTVRRTIASSRVREEILEAKNLKGENTFLLIAKQYRFTELVARILDIVSDPKHSETDPISLIGNLQEIFDVLPEDLVKKNDLQAPEEPVELDVFQKIRRGIQDPGIQEFIKRNPFKESKGSKKLHLLAKEMKKNHIDLGTEDLAHIWQALPWILNIDVQDSPNNNVYKYGIRKAHWTIEGFSRRGNRKERHRSVPMQSQPRDTEGGMMMEGKPLEDTAMLTADDQVGGIDLSAIGGSASGGNPNQIKIETKGKGMDFNSFNPATFEDHAIQGFVPVIIQITPVTNIPLMLGINPQQKVDELSLNH